MKRKPVLLVAATIAAIAFSSAAFGQKALSISEVQGDRNTSPHEREIVTVTGVVTVRTKTGFFIQTPDDKTDGNPATSGHFRLYEKSAARRDSDRQPCLGRGRGAGISQSKRCWLVDDHRAIASARTRPLQHLVESERAAKADRPHRRRFFIKCRRRARTL